MLTRAILVITVGALLAPLEQAQGLIAPIEAKEVAKKLNIYGVYDVTGRSDVMVVARFKSKEELSEFVKSLLSSEFVDLGNLSISLQAMKRRKRWST